MVKLIDNPSVKKSWPVVKEILMIHTRREYDRAVETLNSLLDEIKDDESHPLYGLLEVMGTLIEHYEHDYIDLGKVSGVAALKFLMEEHDLSQSDLPEIGSQGVVSEILNQKRQLNVNQIKKLSERFKVSPEVFFD